MYEFHTDYKKYFDIQLSNARQWVLPFVEQAKKIEPGMQLLEIGCGQGSLLRAFAEKGCICTGVEMYPLWLEKAKEWLQPELQSGAVKLIDSNIYDVDPEKDLGTKFDIIILKDVIEHIHDQQKLIGWMKHFLKPAINGKPGGVIFFGFPPWQMPYGGHQQMMQGWLGKTPYWHLLPMPLFKGLMKVNKQYSEDLVEIKETGITIERFENILRKTGYKVLQQKHWLINPVYEYKFGWRPRVQFALVKAIPFVRNFLTTAVYYIVTPAAPAADLMSVYGHKPTTQTNNQTSE
ncbi:MAG: class I SAM-dependent methyltransferase [Chitinophagaceae bacterium]|nr:MAG: class I SAM-dependent methyltransferase [Chitinophagaceae bacterium]